METENFQNTKEFVHQSFQFIKEMLQMIRTSEVNVIIHQQSLLELLPAVMNEVLFSSTIKDTDGKDSIPDNFN